MFRAARHPAPVRPDQKWGAGLAGAFLRAHARACGRLSWRHRGLVLDRGRGSRRPRAAVQGGHRCRTGSDWRRVRGGLAHGRRAPAGTRRIASREMHRQLARGDLDDAARAYLEERLGDRVRVVGRAAGMRRAAVLAELAWEQLRRGQGQDPALVEPIYVSEPNASAGA